MAELQATGSIKAGMSTPAILEQAVRPDELTVTDEIRHSWQVITGLINHADNRMDNDYPGSYPAGGVPGNELTNGVEQLVPYIKYLSGGPEEIQGKTFLTDTQLTAFTEMRAILQADATIDSFGFSQTMFQWVLTASQAKHEAHSSARYLELRRHEGRLIGGLFGAVVPPAAAGKKFEKFKRLTEQLGEAGKLGDTAIDLKKDVAQRKVRIEGSTALRAKAALLTGTELTKVVVQRPRLAKLIGHKALLFVKNRMGKHNAQRTHS